MTKPVRRLTTRNKDALFSGALIAPTLLVTVVFILIPVVDSVIKSFLAYKVKNIISGKPGEWNDFANYIKLFNNDKLLPAIQVTFMFVIAAVLLQFVLGMAMALILNSNIRFSRIFRSVMMVPWVVPTVISALIYGALTAATHAVMGAIGSNAIVAIIVAVIGIALIVFGRIKHKTPLFIIGIVAALLGILSMVHNLGGFFGEIPFLAIGIPAVTGAYFDWFGGCIQAFIFCTLTTLFIKQAAGD